MDYYEILGVHPDASAHAIKSAYRRLAKIHHPDRNPQDPVRAQKKIQLVNEAYAVLSKPDKRWEYDNRRTRGEDRRVSREEYAGDERRSGQERRAGEERSAGPQAGRQGAGGAHRRNAGYSHGGPEFESTGNVYADQRVQDIMNEARKRFSTAHHNRFESKDAFFAVVACFILMTQAAPAGFWNAGNLMLAWPLFAAAILVAQLARAASGYVYAMVFRAPAESYMLMLVSNAAAAIAFGMVTGIVEGPLRESIFIHPVTPALLAAIIPGAVGAGFGRAFNRSLNVFAGMAGGALAGALTCVPFMLWMVLAAVTSAGGEMGTGGEENFFFSGRALVYSAMIAGVLGSFRVSTLFIFTFLEWMQGFFEKTFPPPENSKALVPRN